MIAKTLEINWHDGHAVYSIDFSSDGQRFATAGADTSVRLWSVRRQTDDDILKTNRNSAQQLPVSIEFLSELRRHSSSVNVVRFSPNSEYLASAGDDACVILWKLSTNNEPAFGSECSEFAKEAWTPAQMLYGHNKEIYDLAWSPCGNYFITASIDNTARIWSVSERTAIHVFADHTHYVQGVAWDPLGQFVATQSSDRTMAIYKYQKGSNGRLHFGNCSRRHNYLDRAKIDKEMMYNREPTPVTTSTTAPTSTSAEPDIGTEAGTGRTANTEDVTSGTFRLYHDENLVSFFRRLSFSPDGAILVTPAGLYKNKAGSFPAISANDDEMQYCSYIYARNTVLKYPLALTGNHSKPSTAVRWCPQVFERRSSKHSSLFNLPYRIVYAVATQDSVYIYDTQQINPICAISGMHFAPITDLSWSSNGTILAFSSADGYCSAAVFTDSELGVPLLEPLFVNQTCDTEMTEAMAPVTTCNLHPNANFADPITPTAAPKASITRWVNDINDCKKEESNYLSSTTASSLSLPATLSPSASDISLSTPSSTSVLPAVTKRRITPIFVSPNGTCTESLPYEKNSNSNCESNNVNNNNDGSNGNGNDNNNNTYKNNNNNSSNRISDKVSNNSGNKSSDTHPNAKKRRIAPTPVNVSRSSS